MGTFHEIHEALLWGMFAATLFVACSLFSLRALPWRLSIEQVGAEVVFAQRTAPGHPNSPR